MFHNFNDLHSECSLVVVYPDGTVRVGQTSDVRASQLITAYLDTEDRFASGQDALLPSAVDAMLYPPSVGETQYGYDPDDVSNGCNSGITPNSSRFDRDVAATELEANISSLDALELATRRQLRKTYLDVRGKCEAAKNRTIKSFSFRDAWNVAKEEMRAQRKALNELSAVRRRLKNEIAAILGEYRHLTRWLTSDMEGLGDAELEFLAPNTLLADEAPSLRATFFPPINPSFIPPPFVEFDIARRTNVGPKRRVSAKKAARWAKLVEKFGVNPCPLRSARQR